MPVTIAYCNYCLSTVFSFVIQRLACNMQQRQADLTHFSFAFNGIYNNTPAGITVAGDGLFFKRIA
jgi:hypothetical protein